MKKIDEKDQQTVEIVELLLHKKQCHRLLTAVH